MSGSSKIILKFYWVFGCMGFLEEFSCFNSCLNPKKTLFENTIFISLWEEFFFCENNIITQEFKKITSYAIKSFVIIFDVISYYFFKNS